MNQIAVQAPPVGGAPGQPAPAVRRKDAVEAIYATGHWLLARGRIVDALKVFRAMTLVAPTDERTWLALGACHAELAQPLIALEMYGIGSAMARPSVRCEIARARALTAMGRQAEADWALDAADALANELDDEDLCALVRAERRGP